MINIDAESDIQSFTGPHIPGMSAFKSAKIIVHGAVMFNDVHEVAGNGKDTDGGLRGQVNKVDPPLTPARLKEIFPLPGCNSNVRIRNDFNSV